MSPGHTRTDMLSNLAIRDFEQADSPAIESLYPMAFPDEDLLPLVRALSKPGTRAISIVSVGDSQVAGHVIFTLCGISGNGPRAALLAPLAVAPECQRQGVGTALVTAGLERMKQEGVDVVFVLGDPAYYGRLGFEPEVLIEPPYPLPPEWDGAWQSLYIDGALRGSKGRLRVPSEWQDRALWAP